MSELSPFDSAQSQRDEGHATIEAAAEAMGVPLEWGVDIAGERMKDERFFRLIQAQKPSLWNKIVAWAREFLNRFLGGVPEECKRYFGKDSRAFSKALSLASDAMVEFKARDGEAARRSFIRRMARQYSVSESEADRQYGELENRYFNPDGSEKPGAMLAPNGERTRLTKRQWIQVRTQMFKDWAGNWDLKYKEIPIVGVEKAPFNNVRDALYWADSHGVIGLMRGEDTGGKGEISISASSIREMMNPSQLQKSANRQAHYSVLMQLRNVIRDSEITEIHPDYRKDENETRNIHGAINPNIEIELIHGCVSWVDGNLYREKQRLDVMSQTTSQSRRILMK